MLVREPLRSRIMNLNIPDFELYIEVVVNKLDMKNDEEVILFLLTYRRILLDSLFAS